jgi:hypothetical protein
MSKAKPFNIAKKMVWEAFQHVKANQGAAGVDGQSIQDFEARLAGNLYKLRNRLSSGSYMPPPVRRVDIPKANGGTRSLGIPTMADRFAQEVVRRTLEPVLEPMFHRDSYGYRPGRSAIVWTRAERWEPYELRGSRTVLGRAGCVIPPRDSLAVTSAGENVSAAWRGAIGSNIMRLDGAVRAMIRAAVELPQARQGRIWPYVGDRDHVAAVYDYTAGPEVFLKRIEGIYRPMPMSPTTPFHQAGARDGGSGLLGALSRHGRYPE